VISDDGTQLGIMSIEDALNRAGEQNVDLVQVNPNAKPPVCRLMDYGKYKFRQTKKEKEAKKKQHTVRVKEIKLRPRIDEHDYHVKFENARKFLSKGNKVKITLIFRGRELRHREIGEEKLKQFCDEIVESNAGTLESNAKKMGRNMVVYIAPVKSH
jgi:translation initiation factor IF-3